MGWQIIQQPNKKFCIFSTVVDNIIYYNATKDQIIDYFLQEERKRVARNIEEIFQEIESGGKPYFQFTKSFEQMIDLIDRVHGKRESNKVLKLIDERES